MLSEGAVDDFLDDFIEFVESVNLGCGGSCSSSGMAQHLTKYVSTRRKSNGKMRYRDDHCTDLDREKVKKWIEARVSLKMIIVHPLEGAWYGGK